MMNYKNNNIIININNRQKIKEQKMINSCLNENNSKNVKKKKKILLMILK